MQDTSTTRIARVKARAVDVPRPYPARTAVGVVATAPLVLIDLHPACGTIGAWTPGP